MMKSKKVVLYCLCCLFVTTASAQPLEQTGYSDWQQWRINYEQSVSGKGGWLSLAGLYWLSEGENSIGSAKENLHRLPPETPEYLATITVSKDVLMLSTQNPDIKVNGQSVTTTQLSVKDRSKVTFSNYEFYVIKREKGYAIRLINHSAEKARNFTGTQFISYDQNWVVPAKLIVHDSPQTIKIPTVYGTTREDKSAGWLEFLINGQTQRLEAVDYGRDTLMYVMFSDTTSGETTYGAGRYIEVEWPDKHGHTLIDFNRAYNPPCAFTNFATCPLTPTQNRLKIAIEAGELDVAK